MGVFLFLVGFLVYAVCGVIILIKAFRVSAGWGLAVMFLPFAGLIFVINNWKDCKNPFLGSLAGGVLILMGAFLIPDTRDDSDSPAEARMASRETTNDNDTAESAPPPANYASAASTPYQPPRSAYVPAYNPPAAPAPAVATDTQADEDQWTRKPQFEQVYVDRTTNQFYAENCKKKPEGGYRIPRSVALMQGMTAAKCATR